MSTHTASWISKTLRHSILATAGYRCTYCGVALDVRSGSRDGLDHVSPRTPRNLRRRENLVACCGACNRAKGASDLVAWLLGSDRGSACLARLAPALLALAGAQ
jgi:5-methylcytosine-specific restriction endonuclease McrA